VKKDQNTVIRVDKVIQVKRDQNTVIQVENKNLKKNNNKKKKANIK
jgi:hypothetical protein